jgi:hypothetical protein
VDAEYRCGDHTVVIGAILSSNDTWVTEVRARKTEAPDSSHEGADITVSWPDGDA